MAKTVDEAFIQSVISRVFKLIDPAVNEFPEEKYVLLSRMQSSAGSILSDGVSVVQEPADMRGLGAAYYAKTSCKSLLASMKLCSERDLFDLDVELMADLTTISNALDEKYLELRSLDEADKLEGEKNRKMIASE